MLAFLYLKENANSIHNSYLRMIVDSTDCFEDLKKNLLIGITSFSHKDSTFKELYDERKRLLKDFPEEDIIVDVNASLFEWVIENLCKNAVDAMEGQGTITLRISQDDSKAFVEVEDTGKGIRKKDIRNVFTPGFTTKKRGWGLGLSLAKRIVEEYHKGRIFVKNSELGKGTTFRIELRK